MIRTSCARRQCFYINFPQWFDFPIVESMQLQQPVLHNLGQKVETCHAHCSLNGAKDHSTGVAMPLVLAIVWQWRQEIQVHVCRVKAALVLEYALPPDQRLAVSLISLGRRGSAVAGSKRAELGLPSLLPVKEEVQVL